MPRKRRHPVDADTTLTASGPDDPTESRIVQSSTTPADKQQLRQELLRLIVKKEAERRRFIEAPDT